MEDDTEYEVESAVESAKESPLDNRPIKMAIFRIEGYFNMTTVYHPDQTIIDVIAKEEVLDFSQVDVDWDDLNDQLEEYMEEEWMDEVQEKEKFKLEYIKRRFRYGRI